MRLVVAFVSPALPQSILFSLSLSLALEINRMPFIPTLTLCIAPRALIPYPIIIGERNPFQPLSSLKITLAVNGEPKVETSVTSAVRGLVWMRRGLDGGNATREYLLRGIWAMMRMKNARCLGGIERI